MALPYWPLTNAGVNDATKINADLAYLDGRSGYSDADARAAISNTITGLTYNTTTGVWSLTPGYVIPLIGSAPALHAASHAPNAADTVFPIAATGWLHSTAGGVLAWTTPTYSDVGAAPALSLTTGYIPKAASANTLADSIIYDNGSVIGINRVPETWATGYNAIHLGGVGALMFNASEGAGNLVDIYNNIYFDNGGFKRIVNDECSIYRQLNGIHLWYSDAAGTADVGFTPTERMRLDAAGNLGLGAIASSVLSGYISFRHGGNTNLISSLATGVSSGFGIYQNINYDSDGLFKRYSTDECSIYYQEAGEHRWYCDASGTADVGFTPTERMRLTASGYLGIGTASPVSLFDVRDGSVNYTLTGFAHGITGYLPTNSFLQFSSITTTGGAIVRGVSSVGGDNGMTVQGFNSGASTSVAPLSFVSAKADSTTVKTCASTDLAFSFANFTTRMVSILGSGSVGIGTSSPYTLLELSQVGTAKSNLDMLTLTNRANAADMNGTATSILFRQYYYDATTPAAYDLGSLQFSTFSDAVASSGRDGQLTISLADGGATNEPRIRAISYGTLYLDLLNITGTYTDDQKTAFGISDDHIFGRINGISSSVHGLNISAYRRSSGITMQFVTNSTTSSTFARFAFVSNTWDGATGLQAAGSTTPILTVTNYTTLLFGIYGDGNTSIGSGVPTARFSVDEKCGIVTVDGFSGNAIRATAGETISKGMVVSWSTTADDRVLKTPANGDMPIGVAAEDIASGSDGWIIVSGYAWVLMESGKTATHGDILYMSATAGYADQGSSLPSVTLHNREIGHCVRTGTSGSITLATLHFN